MADVVEIILALRNVRGFVSEADQAAKAIGGVGTASEQSGKKAGIGWKGIAKWAGAAGAVVGVTKLLKSATGATEGLARSTLTLQRTTGMETETASEWSALLKERGISTRQFQTSLVKLSRTMEASRTGTAKEAATIADLRSQIDQVSAAGGKDAPRQLAKLSSAIARAETAGAKARAVLDRLGVTQAELAKGNTPQVLGKVADAIAKTENPAERAALAQQLFGRSGVALLPILMKGSAGVQELLDRQKEYGNYLTGHSIEDTKKMIEQQRELDGRWEGAKVQLGTQLLPVLIQASKVLVSLARILKPLTSNALAFKIAIGLIAAAFVAYKVAIIAATIAQLNLNVAMLANPVGLIIVGVVALGVALVVLYKKWKWFHNAVDATWHWVKRNWPLLLAILVGPFALAAVLVIKHFGEIKQFALGVVAAVKRAIEELVAWVRNIPGKVGGFLKKIPGVKLASSALGHIPHPHLAEGGTVVRQGGVVVGERGPELLSLPTGAEVVPLGVTGGAGGARPLRIVVPVYLDRREIARAVARVGADQLARR